MTLKNISQMLKDTVHKLESSPSFKIYFLGLILIISAIIIAIINDGITLQYTISIKDIMSIGGALIIANLIAWNIEKNLSDYRREKDLILEQSKDIIAHLDSIIKSAYETNSLNFFLTASQATTIRSASHELYNILESGNYNKKTKQISKEILSTTRNLQTALTGKHLTISDGIIRLNEENRSDITHSYHYSKRLLIKLKIEVTRS